MLLLTAFTHPLLLQPLLTHSCCYLAHRLLLPCSCSPDFAHPVLLTRSCFQVRAIKQITVHEPPNVLTIHLKRFEFGGFGSKISKKVRQWLHDQEERCAYAYSCQCNSKR